MSIIKTKNPYFTSKTFQSSLVNKSPWQVQEKVPHASHSLVTSLSQAYTSSLLSTWRGSTPGTAVPQMFPPSLTVQVFEDEILWAEYSGENTKMWLMVDWFLRVQTPLWLDFAGLNMQSSLLRNLPAISNLDEALESAVTLFEVRDFLEEKEHLLPGGIQFHHVCTEARIAVKQSGMLASEGLIHSGQWLSGSEVKVVSPVVLAASDISWNALLLAGMSLPKGKESLEGFLKVPVLKLQKSSLDIIALMMK